MKYVCQICGYVYDDEKENVLFQDLPDDWVCPLCGASKAFFEAKKNSETEKKEINISTVELKDQPLSAGQAAMICSNLARGAEKQYNMQEAVLFQQLSEYFSSAVSVLEDASLQSLSSILKKDIEAYAETRAVADAYGDRGAARVCVWGEKVTRIEASLVDRYIHDGEKMLIDTNVWVCSVCGFIYVGDTAPKLCPVCKVPDWKFEKVEGRA